jgi:hypothetical protein
MGGTADKSRSSRGGEQPAVVTDNNINASSTAPTAAERRAARIRELVDATPPLSPAQRSMIAAAFTRDDYQPVRLVIDEAHIPPATSVPDLLRRIVREARR